MSHLFYIRNLWGIVNIACLIITFVWLPKNKNACGIKDFRRLATVVLIYTISAMIMDVAGSLQDFESALLIAMSFRFWLPYFYLAFVIGYVGIKNPLVEKIKKALLVIQCAFVAIAWTNPLHRLLYGQIEAVASGGFAVSWEPVFYIEKLLGYFAVAMAYYFVFKLFKVSQSKIQTQVLVSIIIVLPLFLESLGYGFSGGNVTRSSLTLSFGAVTLLTGICFFRYLKDVRSAAVEKMADIFYVFDFNGRCVDVNPAGIEFLKDKIDVDNFSLNEMLAYFAIPELKARGATEFSFKQGGDTAYYSAIVLEIERGIRGKCVIIHEITHSKKEIASLNRAATVDVLTNTMNRRGLSEVGTAMFQDAEKTQNEMAVLMMDLDHFKNVNDTYGHPAGDSALFAFARICEHNIRNSDILCRYGGEEFVALLKNVDVDKTEMITGRILETIRNKEIVFNDIKIRMTVSIGAVVFAASSVATLEEAIVEADRQLYMAKSGGRDRCCMKIIEGNA